MCDIWLSYILVFLHILWVVSLFIPDFSVYYKYIYIILYYKYISVHMCVYVSAYDYLLIVISLCCTI